VRRADVFALLTLLLAWLPGSEVRAESEAEVKAAFLYNFARYVEWPEGTFADPQVPVVVCVRGDDAFREIVDETVEGKTVGDRPVVVERDGSGNERACHLLYVGDGVSDARSLLERLADRSVFTVSDRSGFAERGGIANFFRAENRIRFEINPEAARRAGLRISSRLLRLAKVVE